MHSRKDITAILDFDALFEKDTLGICICVYISLAVLQDFRLHTQNPSFSVHLGRLLDIHNH